MSPKQLYPILVILLLCLTHNQLSAQDLHRQNTDLPCLNKNFNVAVHVAVDSLNRQPVISDILINRMLEEVSEFYSPICLSFSACEINIIEDNYAYSNLQNIPIPTSERYEKMETLFKKENRINVFIVDSIESVNCGFSSFNGIRTPDKANVVIELHSCPDSKPSQNLAHQIGHLFGLYDTFNIASDLELPDGSNCETAGDFLCDTPADPFGKIIPDPDNPGVFFVGNYNINCEFIFSGRDTNGDYWQPDMGNIMSSYPCKCGFTRQQYLKIVEVYNSSSFKQF